MLLLPCILITFFQILVRKSLLLFYTNKFTTSFLHLRLYRLLLWFITIFVNPFLLLSVASADSYHGALFLECLFLFFFFFYYKLLISLKITCGDSVRSPMKVNSFKEYYTYFYQVLRILPIQSHFKTVT